MTSQTTNKLLRVASVPCNQVYIRHLEMPEAPNGIEVQRLPDPIPSAGAQSQQSSWWPPQMLQPDWIAEHHEEFDLMHIHFGFDALDPRTLKSALRELRRAGKPLVYTVHDLINPHQPDPSAHEALLDVLIPGADELITLTEGAASDIFARWGRTAHVLPHPHVIDFDTMARLREERAQRNDEGSRPRRIGVHLKGLRPNMSVEIIEPLARIIEGMDGCTLQVNIHRQVLDPHHGEYLQALADDLKQGHEAGRWELVAHEYFTEGGFFDYFGALDVNVLPYRFGTHSGWLEAALDAGVAVIAPDRGHYAGQDSSVATYRWDGDRVDTDSLSQALRRQLGLPFIPGMNVQARRAQREALAESHQRLYCSLAGH